MKQRGTRRLKYFFAVAQLSLLLSQSGCVVMASASWPLWLPGGMIIVSGTVMTLSGFVTHNCSDYRDGAFFTLIGVVLGNEDPRETITLKQIPRGDQLLMNRLHITNDDIEEYNENLNHIRKIVIGVIEDIRSQKDRFQASKFTLSELNDDPELNLICQKYGFEDVAALVASFKQSKLSQDQVESFAVKMKLPISQAKLLLYHSFGADLQSEF